MRTVTGLVVHPDGEAAAVTVDATLETLRAVIGGGWLEAVIGPDWFAYVDEDGKALGLPVNGVATRLARAIGWVGKPGDYLSGPVLFLGASGSTEVDAPRNVWDAAVRLGVWQPPPP
jgi:hypothetical protein